MRRTRALLIVIALISTASLVISILSYHREGNIQMEFEDSLGYRINQLINAKAAVQPAAGTGATASANGNDAVGQINLTTGTSPGAGSLVHVTFTQPYKAQPFVYVTPEDQAPPVGWYVTIDWNGFDIWVGTPPKANTNYPFNYLIVARPWSMYLGPNGEPVDANGNPSQY
jgi:hypothetical protein